MLSCPLRRCGRCRATLAWPSCASGWVVLGLCGNGGRLIEPGVCAWHGAMASAPAHGRQGSLQRRSKRSSKRRQLCAVTVPGPAPAPAHYTPAGGDGRHPGGEAAAGGRPGGGCWRLQPSAYSSWGGHPCVDAALGLVGDEGAGAEPALLAAETTAIAAWLPPGHTREPPPSSRHPPSFPHRGAAGGHRLRRGVALAPRVVGAQLGLRGVRGCVWR